MPGAWRLAVEHPAWTDAGNSPVSLSARRGAARCCMLMAVVLAALAVLLVVAWLPAPLLRADERPQLIFPEQRSIPLRSPEMLPHAPLPDAAPPRTVTEQPTDLEEWRISLDEAVRTALANARVVRVLAGVTAASSGRTIYDPAIQNTAVDEARAPFDPTLSVDNVFNQTDTPGAEFLPGDPTRARFRGRRVDGYQFNTTLSQQNVTGGTASLRVDAQEARVRPGALPLNPQTTSGLELSYVQPLWQGGGIEANLAPMVVARIDTERSFFQYKNSVQELVRGVIQAYWSLVFARTNRWARQQQVDQSQFAFERAEARFAAELADVAEVSQTRVAYANFRASLVAAEAEVLDREAALRNILGLPPSDTRELVPISYPRRVRMEFDWSALMLLAEERRPDLIELKLILEADQQQLILAENAEQPRLDAIARYRWDGLTGLMPNNSQISVGGEDYSGWTLGVNFSVPIGLRASRAGVRRRELLIARDQANLDQGVHAAVHQVALVVRSQANAFAQYEVFQETRAAATDNLEQQFAEYESGRVNFINVVQAISDWGNAVSSEAQALTQYNSTLADLESETGTILESHGVTFVEERFGALAPLGLFGGRWHYPTACYPYALPPTENTPHYEASDEPAEESFELQTPFKAKGDERSEDPAVGDDAAADDAEESAQAAGDDVEQQEAEDAPWPLRIRLR